MSTEVKERGRSTNENVREQVSAEERLTRNRRPSTEVDKERAETYLKSLPLADRVELVKSLKAGIDAEVKSLTEAATNAASLTNGL